MKTRIVFIDTQAFMQQSFKFDSEVFKKLCELGENNKISILISDVVKREVESKLKINIEDICRKKKSLTKLLLSLDSNAPKDLIKALDEFNDKVIESHTLSGWNNFLKNGCVTVIDPNNCCNSQLLSKYFSGDFPFGPGKKKVNSQMPYLC